MIAIQDLAIVILAAGSSSRMGKSKQMLDVGGQTLLEKTVASALNSNISNINVVLGSDYELHRQTLEGKSVKILINSNWALGMGNTLKFSVKKLLESKTDIQGILFMVCDQPQISSSHINAIADLFLRENPMAVASKYNGTMGIPAIFDRIAFSGLLSIGNNVGAKEILKKLNNKHLKLIPFAGGEIDLDTPEDYQQFISQIKK